MTFLTLADDTKIYYRESGTGRPVIFIPGWCYTADLFEKNLPVVARNHRAVSYDPRSHGRSTVTATGNNYTRHGRDLHEVIQLLKLRAPVLVGWSLGATAAYAYFDQYGTDAISAFISVDETPTIRKQAEDDWGEGTTEELQALISLVATDDNTYLQFFKDYMADGFVAAPAPELVERFSNYARTMSAGVAAGLLQDAGERDYADVARTVSEQMPVLQVVREGWSASARRWIRKNQPTAKVEVLGAHLMLHEFADEFNNIVLEFLRENPAG